MALASMSVTLAPLRRQVSITLASSARLFEPIRNACAVADSPRDHPVAQLALSCVVGQWQQRVEQNTRDGRPIIEELARDGAQRLVRGIAVCCAEFFELPQLACMGRSAAVALVDRAGPWAVSL